MALARRYGIITDIHGNYPALQVALDYLNQVGVDKILNLGDLVGYGAFPSDVIGTCMDRVDMSTIMGNHDRQLTGEKDPSMRKTAIKAIEWTRDNITSAQLRYISNLPQGQTIDNTFITVHGSLEDRDAYVLTAMEVKRNLECMINEFPGFKICFFGHTHIPMLIGTKAIITDLKDTKTFQLDPNDVYLINPGSVGQPRDRCPLSAFGVFDTENWTMTFVRQPYDIRAAQRRIIENGLPEKFARRLAVGI